MSARSLLAEIQDEAKSGINFDWKKARERIHDEHAKAETSDDRAILVALHVAVMDQVERTGVEREKLDEFRKARAQDYALLIVRESTVNENVSPQLLDVVTQREVSAGRMPFDHDLKKLASAGLLMTAGGGTPEPTPSTGIRNMIRRFWGKA